MPTTTFFNLPAHKQERLLDAATREFSAKPYNEASLNKIIQDAGIPRGSLYMYFQDKEDLFRYLVGGYMDQLLMVLEESLLRERGDVFAALMGLFDYVCRRGREQGLGSAGAMMSIVSRNGGMQKNVLLELVDAAGVLQRLRELVNPDILDLRRERDLDDMLGVLLSVAGPLIYSGIQQEGGGRSRDHLANILDILRRGMGREPSLPAGQIDNDKEKNT